MSLIKNTAGQQCSARVVSRTDGTNITTGVTVTVEVDGAAQAAGGGAISHKGNGSWEYLPTQAETNCDHLTVCFNAANAVGVNKEYFPSEQIDIDNNNRVRSNVHSINDTQIDGDGTPADKFRALGQ